MINKNTKKLQIFENFQIDYNLPKYKDNTHGNLIISNDMIISNSSVFPSSWQSSVGIQENETINFKKIYLDYLRSKSNLFSKIQLKIFEYILPELKVNKKPDFISVEKFFNELNKNSLTLSHIKDISEHYDKALSNALLAGQQALVEKLNKMLEVVRAEAYLIEYNITQYLDENQLISFYNKIFEKGQEKYLKLSWIKNFCRPIPEKIINYKQKIDEAKIFDNYVILHLDLKNDATDLTEEEKKKAKDPILFGVINGSNRLYFIADWKDEYCDLTLEQLLNEIDDDVNNINNESVKLRINQAVKSEKKKKI